MNTAEDHRLAVAWCWIVGLIMAAVVLQAVLG